MDANDLKAVRTRLRLSQAELADLLGVHLMTVSKWERGVNPIPDAVGEVLPAVERGGMPRRRLGRKRRTADPVSVP